MIRPHQVAVMQRRSTQNKNSYKTGTCLVECETVVHRVLWDTPWWRDPHAHCWRSVQFSHWGMFHGMFHVSHAPCWTGLPCDGEASRQSSPYWSGLPMLKKCPLCAPSLKEHWSISWERDMVFSTAENADFVWHVRECTFCDWQVFSHWLMCLYSQLIDWSIDSSLTVRRHQDNGVRSIRVGRYKDHLGHRSRLQGGGTKEEWHQTCHKTVTVKQ